MTINKQGIDPEIFPIENENDLLSLSCNIKRDAFDFFTRLQEKKGIRICFIAKVAKCTETNNFFLTLQLFKDKKFGQDNYNYNTKVLQRNLIKELKETYKNYNISFFRSEQVEEESIPKCKIIHDCFSVDKEFRNEMIKTWILQAFLYVGLFKTRNKNVRQMYGISKVLNYDIVSRSRTTFNKVLTNVTSWVGNLSVFRSLQEKLETLISNYISDDLIKRFQDTGNIRVIFHRNLQDYSKILDVTTYDEKMNGSFASIKDKMNNRVNIMNKQLNYLKTSDIDNEYMYQVVDKITKDLSKFEFKSFFTNLFGIKNKKQQSLSQLKEEFESESISLIPEKPIDKVIFIRVRSDMLTFDVFEYFKLCFKNINYNIENMDSNNRVSIPSDNDSFYRYFKINFNEEISNPYIYVQSVTKNGLVILRNAAKTKQIKRQTLSNFRSSFDKFKQQKKRQAIKQQQPHLNRKKSLQTKRNNSSFVQNTNVITVQRMFNPSVTTDATKQLMKPKRDFQSISGIHKIKPVVTQKNIGSQTQMKIIDSPVVPPKNIGSQTQMQIIDSYDVFPFGTPQQTPTQKTPVEQLLDQIDRENSTLKDTKTSDQEYTIQLQKMKINLEKILGQSKYKLTSNQQKKRYDNLLQEYKKHVESQTTIKKKQQTNVKDLLKQYQKNIDYVNNNFGKENTNQQIKNIKIIMDKLQKKQKTPNEDKQIYRINQKIDESWVHKILSE